MNESLEPTVTLTWLMLPNSSHLQSDKTPDFRLDQVKTQGSTIMAILRVFDSIINGRRWLTRVR